MNTKFNSWLWPAHPLGKRQVEALQGEHNRLVNSHQQLVGACEAAEVVLSAIECTGEKPLSNGQTLDMIRSALATATGHLKGVQK